MERFKKTDIIETGRLQYGTSASFIGINTKTNKKGIYKENGCLLSVTNEDIREKLASDILSTIKVPCAQIDLVYDEDLQQNACFSNYIISDDEMLINPPTITSEDASNLESFVNSLTLGVQEQTNDSVFALEYKKNLYNKIYLSSLLDSFDLKSANLPYVYNTKTDQYRTCACFDYGVAFVENATQDCQQLSELSSNDVMKYMIKEHYEDIKETVTNVNTILTPENIDLIFSREYLSEFSPEQLEEIKDRFTKNIELSKELQNEMILESTTPEKPLNIFQKIKKKFKSIFNKNKLLETPNVEETSTAINSNPNNNLDLSNLVNEVPEYPPVKEKESKTKDYDTI